MTYFSTYETPPGDAGRNLAKFRSDFQQRWGEAPGLQGAAMYDSLFILQRAIENAEFLGGLFLQEALQKLDMPQLVLPVEGARIRFDANREARFVQFATQLFFDPAVGETRPAIVWPESLAKATFDANTRAVTDVALAVSAPPAAAPGAQVTYTLEVVNRGAEAAQNVVITGATPGWSRMVSIRPSQGSCTAPAMGAAGDISCSVGALSAAGRPGDRAGIQLVVQLADAAAFREAARWSAWTTGISVDATFRVRSATRDSNFNNNAARALVRISSP